MSNMKAIKIIVYIVCQCLGFIPLSIFFVVGGVTQAMAEICDNCVRGMEKFADWLEKECL